MYEPMDFTHQQVIYRDAPRTKYPDGAKGWNRTYIRRTLQSVRDFQERHGAKIYVGEFSAIVWGEGADNYIRDCIDVFEEYGWDWTFHAFREWSGWSVEHEADEPWKQRPSTDNPRKRALLDGLRRDAGHAAYRIGPVGELNADFFSKPPDVRAAIFDKANFVYEIEAFSSRDKALALDADYLAQVPPGVRTLLVRDSTLASLLRIKAVRGKGYRVCIGPLTNLPEVVTALQTAPDYILLDKSLDKTKLRTAILAQKKPERNDFEAIDLSRPGDFTVNYPSSGTRADGARLRVLSYNIQASTWIHRAGVPLRTPLRAPAVIRAVSHFKPDLIGFQEMDWNWYVALAEGMGPYRFTQSNDPSCSIMFDAGRFRLLDKGILPFTDHWMRCLNWALFEDVKTNERFVFTNTHWDLTVPKRLENAKMMSGYLKDLAAKHNVPVICAGDFNCEDASAELRELMASSGLKDAVPEASIRENPNISSWRCTYVTVMPYRNQRHIDHVLFSSELTPLAARLVLGEEVLWASDHLPLVVDLK